MENRFDEFSKVMAGGFSRREALRRLIGITAGALFANLAWVGGVWAQAPGRGGVCCPKERVCKSSAGPFCCPDGTVCVSVPGALPLCCPREQVCRSAGGQPFCCPPDMVCKNGKCVCPPKQVCGNTCCPDGSTCISSATTAPFCCPSDQACGNTCCPDGMSCRDGKCVCPPIRSCGNTCCPEGTVCSFDPTGAIKCCPRKQAYSTPNGVFCCPDGMVFRDGACRCPGNTTPVNGTCCKQKQICGNVCCPDDSDCALAPNGDGNLTQVCCPHRQICQSAAGLPFCCPPNLVCRNGKCVCPPRRACGTSEAPFCCPDGTKCAGGTCVCPNGNSPCVDANGNLSCCADSQPCLPTSAPEGGGT